MNDQERIAAFCELVDSCISDLYCDMLVMECDGPEQWKARKTLIEDYIQQLKELAPSQLHSTLWTLNPENINL